MENSERVLRLNSLAVDTLDFIQFVCSYHRRLHHIGEGGFIHKIGNQVSGRQHDPTKSAGRFLGAALIISDRNAGNRCQVAVEVTDNFTHGDFLWISGKLIAAALARSAGHPIFFLQIEHDVLQEALRDIVTPGQFENRNGGSAPVFH